MNAAARCVVSALFAGVAASPARAADPAADRALASLRANLKGLHDLTAEVTVTTTLKGFLTEQVYRQRYAYAFRRPGWLRVEFREPAGRLVIARGKTVWVDGQRSQGAEPVPGTGGAAADAEASPLSLWSLSLGSPDLGRDYAMTSFIEPNHQRLTGLSLVPRGTAATSVRLRVWVDGTRGVVEESKVFGAKDALLSTSIVSKFARVGRMWLPVEITTLGCEGRCKTVVSYADVKVNSGLPPSRFTP